MGRVDLVARLVSSGQNDCLEIWMGVFIVIVTLKATTGVSHLSILSSSVGGSGLYVVIHVFLTTRRELGGNAIVVTFVVATNAKGDIVILAPRTAAVLERTKMGADVGNGRLDGGE